ncbi:Uncharacterised protein [Cedecea neteri]|uniref:Uncharacterized protein n=1 Tax=Cedecea neteri TaxID=158822 RepID=A0A2X2T116_9ENTR|nr:Uncharacterised protein [Cedecea neteri]
MGWEMHITRAEHVWDGESHPIFAEEWIQCVNNDPELSFESEKWTISRPVARR